LQPQFKDEEGATAIEYGLMVALISVASSVAVTAIDTNLNGIFKTVANTVGSTPGAGS
jgi:pilus assembly protein Flp/PilA